MKQGKTLSFLLIPLHLTIAGCNAPHYMQPTIKHVNYNAEAQARLKVFGPHMRFQMISDRHCFPAVVDPTRFPSLPVPDKNLDKVLIADFTGGNPSKIESTSIGMPDISPYGDSMLPFKEIVIPANKPLIILSSYTVGDQTNHTSCTPYDYYFIPIAGADYEASIELDLHQGNPILGNVQSCSPKLNRITKTAEGTIQIIPVTTNFVKMCP